MPTKKSTGKPKRFANKGDAYKSLGPLEQRRVDLDAARVLRRVSQGIVAETKAAARLMDKQNRLVGALLAAYLTATGRIAVDETRWHGLNDDNTKLREDLRIVKAAFEGLQQDYAELQQLREDELRATPPNDPPIADRHQTKVLADAATR